MVKHITIIGIVDLINRTMVAFALAVVHRMLIICGVVWLEEIHIDCCFRHLLWCDVWCTAVADFFAASNCYQPDDATVVLSSVFSIINASFKCSLRGFKLCISLRHGPILPRDAMLARLYVACNTVALCPCVCLPQVGVLLKLLNTGSRKQHHTIAQGVLFSDVKDLREIRLGSTPTGAPNAGGVG